MNKNIIIFLIISLLLFIQLEAKLIPISRKPHKFLVGDDAINYKNSRSGKSLAGISIIIN